MSSNDNRFRNRNSGITASATVKYAGGAAVPKASFLRPANVTPYDIGDLIADNAVAAQVAPLAFTAAREFASSFFLMKAILTKTSANVANAAFVLHLFKTQPTPVNGDGGIFQSNKAADYLGSITFGAMRAFSDGAWVTGVPDSDGPIVVDLSDLGLDAQGKPLRTIYGLIETRGAYVPGNAEKFEVSLCLQQD